MCISTDFFEPENGHPSREHVVLPDSYQEDRAWKLERGGPVVGELPRPRWKPLPLPVPLEEGASSGTYVEEMVYPSDVVNAADDEGPA